MFHNNAFLTMLSIMVLNFYSDFSVAKDITIPMDISQWEYKGDHFRCLLNQKVKKIGKIEIIAEPDHQIRLEITSFILPQPIENAQIYLLSEPYLDISHKKLVSQSASINKHRITFHQSVSGLISAMSQGAWLQLTSVSGGHPFSIQFPTVNSSKSMARFNQCRAELPELSYKQARDMELNYQLGQRSVTPEQRVMLLHLAEYVQLDKKVSAILIDGHTDNVGSPIGNLQISRVRADDVASILHEAGVHSELIEVRSHGARYPVASNDSEQGKAKNRRVTIRVIRSTDDRE
ncbi:OmpA family protein [Vibrio sp. HA2012]|uniref:OmpA family protein n=1 Tax=Vibrio sp. HA2012 TaxID=1971595 RepID=UPI000C2B61BB|nr:OmpA family protein [Vibrio sp. HA2012]PJC86439.1 OmpA family protein [Vibrio sp. HA2012]